jgi:hypothetical protein
MPRPECSWGWVSRRGRTIRPAREPPGTRWLPSARLGPRWSPRLLLGREQGLVRPVERRIVHPLVKRPQGTFRTRQQEGAITEFLFGLAARGVLRDPAARLDDDLPAPRKAAARGTGRHRDDLRTGDGAALRRRDPVRATDHAVSRPSDRERRHGDPHFDQPVARAGDGVANGQDVRDALDGGRSLPDPDRRAPLRGRDAGLSSGGVVFLRDGRAGVQYVRPGESGAARGARCRSDQGEVVGLPSEERRRGDVRGDGRGGSRRGLGIVPRDAGGNVRGRDD